VLSAQGSVLPTAWTPDGKSIIASKQNPSGEWDLIEIDSRAQGSRLDSVLVRPQSDSIAVNSSDGRWIAWFSNESGRHEIWAAPFPGPGGKWQLSNTGIVMIGSEWGNDEVLYSQDDGGIYAIPLQISGATLSPGSPRLVLRNYRVLSWTLSPDGQRILAAVAADTKTNEPLAIIQNWPLKVAEQ
jgi:WD40 repeat protein